MSSSLAFQKEHYFSWVQFSNQALIVINKNLFSVHIY